MFKYLCIAFSLILVIHQVNGQSRKDSLISQTFYYKTSKAGEVFMVWSLNNWKETPPKRFWPINTFLKDGYAYSKMLNSGDSFTATIKLPAKSYLNYMYWVPIDSNGDSTNGWDTYGDITYSSVFDTEKKIKNDDGALWLPERKKRFDSLQQGASFILVSTAISIIFLFFFRRRLSLKPSKIFHGILIASLLCTFFIRLGMNDLFYQSQAKIFGAISHDVLYFLLIAALFYILTFLAPGSDWLKKTILILFVTLLIVSIAFSFLNIEIVKQLGRPLNYQWLYYSNFMKGTDAKNAVAYKMSNKLSLNLILLLLSVLIFGLTFSLLPSPPTISKNLVITPVVLLLLLCIYQLVSFRYSPSKIANPVVELVSSLITADRRSQLFSMSVSPKTKQFIERYHTIRMNESLPTAGKINNVILFVMESTQKQAVSLYDSTYQVTPNLAKWRNISTVYTNMYSHIPSTPNSMATMISGIYPLISYKSILIEYKNKSLPSLSTELKKQNWKTSLFSSADLTFGNMDEYAKTYDFTTTADSKTIVCDFPKFQVTNTQLDGLDDKCIAKQYLNWSDSLSGEKKFSVLWTNQTHYPYFIEEARQTKYVNGNAELNRYLNALKSSDEAFGILMEGLQKRNALQNTLVIVVGDHGEAFGTHNQTGHANKVYEENVSIPCILYNPLLCKGNTSDDVSGLIDIAPTIANVLGLKPQPEWEGKSLFIQNNNGRTFFICPYSDFVLGTRNGDWKYIFNATLNKQELYNLKNDPKETIDLSKQYPDVVQKEYEMIGAWVQFHNQRLKQLKDRQK
jgi:phosphoglycerol transferase MdoB-like AlkP superfamily enzyme